MQVSLSDFSLDLYFDFLPFYLLSINFAGYSLCSLFCIVASFDAIWYLFGLMDVT